MPSLWSVHDNPSSRLCRIPLPALPHLGAKARDFGVYTSGALFALGWWVFLDVAIYSKAANGGDVHVQFVDWIPLICNILGMLVINSIDKSRLSADSYSYSGNGIAWKARVILFVGFALMAGGLAGAVTVLVLKYLVHDYPFPTLGFGVTLRPLPSVAVRFLLESIFGNLPLASWREILVIFLVPFSAFGGCIDLVPLYCGFRRMLRRMSINIICRSKLTHAVEAAVMEIFPREWIVGDGVKGYSQVSV